MALRELRVAFEAEGEACRGVEHFRLLCSCPKDQREVVPCIGNGESPGREIDARDEAGHQEGLAGRGQDGVVHPGEKPGRGGHPERNERVEARLGGRRHHAGLHAVTAYVPDEQPQDVLADAEVVKEIAADFGAGGDAGTDGNLAEVVVGGREQVLLDLHPARHLLPDPGAEPVECPEEFPLLLGDRHHQVGDRHHADALPVSHDREGVGLQRRVLGKELHRRLVDVEVRGEDDLLPFQVVEQCGDRLSGVEVHGELSAQKVQKFLPADTAEKNAAIGNGYRQQFGVALEEREHRLNW